MSLRDREKQLFARTEPTNFYNKLNYHLKKVEPFRNRTKHTVAEQMKLYTRNEKVSIIPQNKKLIKKPITHFEEPDHINEQHANQNLTSVASQIRIYQTPGTDRKNIFERANSDFKGKKIDIAQRGKSLKFWKVEKPQPKLLTQIKGFFNTFLSEDDGCKCGPYCECSEVLLKWINVPDELIQKNYRRMLRRTYKKESLKMSRLSETQFSDDTPDFDSEYQNSHKKKKEREKHEVQIKKDVIRTQTQCSLFHKKQIQQKMERILMCYSIQDPEVGYVQSMNILLSGVLYHIRDEVKTYAVIRKLFHEIRRIYLSDFKECYKHVDVIIRQLQLQVFDLYQHFEQTGIQMRVILFPWILSLLSVIVPLQYMGIIYVGFVKEGWKFIYKTVLALFVYHKEKLRSMDQNGDILVYLSVSNEQKDPIDWQDIVRYGKNIEIRT